MNSPSETPPKILFADADETLATSASRVLERRGFQVTLVADGEQALARFAPAFQVAILSVSLPKLDGLAVLREIKARAPATEIILLSDAGSISAAMMGLKEGAFAYILKPIADYLQLTHAVERALELSRFRSQAIQPTLPAPAPRNQGLVALNQLAAVIRNSEPQVKMLEGVLKSAAQVFGASKAVVFLSEHSQKLQLVAGLGSPSQTAAARDFIHVVGEEFAWRVANERKALTVASPNKKVFHAGAPLIARGHLLGVLIVYEITPSASDGERLGWLNAFAAHAAAALELARLTEENEGLAQSDPATGAYKENIFLELAEREFRRSWRFNESISVIDVQIDGMDAIFKRSQELGDRVLRIVSDICRQSVRNIDLVGRGKNGSFTLLLLMTDSVGATTVAERISQAVRAIPAENNKDGFRIAVSLGVTTYPHEGCTSLMDLMEIAHSAHLEKRGPSQTVIHQA